MSRMKIGKKHTHTLIILVHAKLRCCFYYLIVILIDLTRHLQLYNVKINKSKCVAFLLCDPGWFVHMLYRNVFSLESILKGMTKTYSEQCRLYS